MSQYRKLFHIMGLTCLVDSELPFQLVNSFDAFETQEQEPDLIFELRQAETMDLSGYSLEQYIEGDLCYWIYRKEGEWLKLCHHKGNPELLRWAAVHRQSAPNRYVYYIFEDYLPALRVFDPFLFLGLPRFLMEHDALLLHASVVRYEGKSILFTAPSGTGKSTQADLWVQYHGAEILNGDRALIRRQEDGYRVYGSPYAGSSYIYRDESAPIRAIIVLRQAPVNRISVMSRKQTFMHIMSQILLFREDRDVMNRQLDAITTLVSRMPIYLLECRPDQEASDLLYEFLKEQD